MKTQFTNSSLKFDYFYFSPPAKRRNSDDPWWCYQANPGWYIWSLRGAWNKALSDSWSNDKFSLWFTNIHNESLRGAWNKALSDSWSNDKFSLWFTNIHNENWKENLAVHQKSLGALFQIPVFQDYFMRLFHVHVTFSMKYWLIIFVLFCFVRYMREQDREDLGQNSWEKSGMYNNVNFLSL